MQCRIAFGKRYRAQRPMTPIQFGVFFAYNERHGTTPQHWAVGSGIGPGIGPGIGSGIGSGMRTGGRFGQSLSAVKRSTVAPYPRLDPSSFDQKSDMCAAYKDRYWHDCTTQLPSPSVSAIIARRAQSLCRFHHFAARSAEVLMAHQSGFTQSGCLAVTSKYSSRRCRLQRECDAARLAHE